MSPVDGAPHDAIAGLLERLHALGLQRPANMGVRSWLLTLADRGLVTSEQASVLAGAYEASRFGGDAQPGALPWQQACEALRQAVDRLETQQQEGTTQPQATPPVAGRPATRVALLAALALVSLAALVFSWDAPPRTHLALPPSDIPAPRPAQPDKNKPPANAAGSSLFVRRVDIPHGGRVGGGVAWVDFDHDGDLDLFLSSDMQMRLLERRGEAFVDVAKRMGLVGPARTGQWADYDGDGDLDLASSANGRTPVLWQREDSRFEPRALSVPTPLNPEGLAWFDHDRDGDTDLLLTNGQEGMHLFDNVEGLVDVSSERGLGPTGHGRFDGDFLYLSDFDDDGLIDVLYTGPAGIALRGTPDRRFALANWQVDLTTPKPAEKRSMAVGDYDGDGRDDLFLPQQGVVSLNQGGGAFKPSPRDRVPPEFEGRLRAAVFGDIDMDGDTDVLVAMNDGGLAVLEQAPQGLQTPVGDTGLSTLAEHLSVVGLALADWDMDGDLDLAFHADAGQSGVLINGVGPRPSRGSLTVAFARPAPPTTTVQVQAKERSQVQRLGQPLNAGSQQHSFALFSVPAGAVELRLTYPTGAEHCATLAVDPAEHVRHVVSDLNTPKCVRGARTGSTGKRRAGSAVKRTPTVDRTVPGR